MADIKLKVNPEKLQGKAGEITTQISNIRKAYESMKSTVNATKGYWAGDAANQFRSYIKDIDKDMQSVLKRLGEHPEDLMKMAGIYVENEKNLSEYASSLPTNVIK